MTTIQINRASSDSEKLTGENFFTRVLQGFASVGSAAVLVAILQILSTAVLARHVNPFQWGGAAFAIAALGFAVIVGQLGLVQAVVYVPRLTPAHVSAASLGAWVWSSGCAAALAAVAPLIEGLSGIPDLRFYVYALAPCIVIRSVTGIAEGTLLRQGRFSLVSFIELSSYAIGNVGVGIAMAVWGGGAWALLCGFIAATATRFAGMIWGAGIQSWSRPASSTYEDLLPFARCQTLAQSANYVATESDNMIVGAIFGPAALGTYGRAYSIAVAPANSISAAIDKVLYPSLVALRRSHCSLSPSYLAVTELAVALALPAAAVAIVAAPEIVLTLLGEGWASAILPLQILSIGLMFRALFQMADCFCRAVGAVYGSSIRQSAYAAFVIVASLVGSAWGPAGVAAGVVAAMAAKYVMMAQFSLASLQLPAGSYFQAIGEGAKKGSLITLAALATIQFCRHAHSPALLTCVAAAAVLAAAAAVRIRSVGVEGLVLN
jgi:PST family polysaccharide transporter